MRSIPRDVWIGLAMLVGAVLYWLGADGIPISPLDGEINAAAMPKALAYALAALAVLLIVRALSVEVMTRRAVARSGSDASAAPKPADPEETARKRRAHLRAAGMFAFGLAYLLVLTTLGYAVSVALLLFGVAIYIGMRPSLRLAGTVVGLAAAFYVVFVLALGIPLPPGVWTSLIN